MHIFTIIRNQRKPFNRYFVYGNGNMQGKSKLRHPALCCLRLFEKSGDGYAEYAKRYVVARGS